MHVTEKPHCRRTHPIVLKVMDTISQDPEIYRMFMQMIRIVFEATPYPSLCSLRVDVLMNFHDLDCDPVCTRACIQWKTN